MEPLKAQEPTTAGVGAESSRATDAESAGALDASALDGYQASLQRLCAILGIDFGLSAREVDVLELLVLGKDAKAIADELFISFNTVRSHTVASTASWTCTRARSCSIRCAGKLNSVSPDHRLHSF